MSELQTPDFAAIAEGLKKDVRIYARESYLNWFTESFRKQGFTDISFVKWQKRKKPDRRQGGAILIDTAFLMKSLAVLSETETTIEFGTHVPYAAVHNFGLRVRAIQYVKPHHRKIKNSDKRMQVQRHARKVDIKYPKRQFLGYTQKGKEQVDMWLFAQIQKRFNTK